MIYTKAETVKFVEDMDEAGIETEHYHGRYFWEGPAVRTNEDGGLTLQDVIRATTVGVQWDTMGRSDYIVYPRVSDKGKEDGNG